MAVNDRSNNPQGNAPADTSQPGPRGKVEHREPDLGAHGEPRQQSKPSVGLDNINQIFRRSGRYDRSDKRTSETLTALTKVRDIAVEQQFLNQDFEILSFDRDANSVGMSAVLVTKTFDKGNVRNVLVRTLLVDSREIVDELRPRVGQYGNERYEIPTLPVNVFNELYWNRLSAFIARREGTKNIEVFDVGSLLIEREFDLEDHREVAKILVNSVNRCDDVMQKMKQEEPFVATRIKADNERLVAQIDTHGEQQQSITGMPIRSDIMVKLRRQAQNTSGDPNDFYEQNTEINSVSMYTSLEYNPDPAHFQSQWHAQQNPNQTIPSQLFDPAIILTQVHQADWIQALTPELYLLALSNAYRVTARSAWIASLLPRRGVDGVDFRDIGALGYMTEARQHFDVKSDSVSDKEILGFMQSMIRTKPAFFTDVNLTGECSLIESFFLDSAMQGGTAHHANTMLTTAANNLTDNAFSRFLPENAGPWAYPTGQEINAGYYHSKDSAGNVIKRDLRDLDVLAVLNLTQGDIDQFIEWYRTLHDTNSPVEKRLLNREQMEREMLDSKLRITGRYQRLALNPVVLEALHNATEQAGISVAYNDIASNFGAQRFQGNGLVGNFAVSGQASMGYGPGQQSYTPGLHGAGSRRYY